MSFCKYVVIVRTGKIDIEKKSFITPSSVISITRGKIMKKNLYNDIDIQNNKCVVPY